MIQKLTETEMARQRARINKQRAADKQVNESRLVTLTEANYDRTARKLTLTICKPGHAVKGDGRYIPKDVLKEAVDKFKNVKMLSGHGRGGGGNWVATLDSAWIEADGSLRGTATVIDSAFADKLANLASMGKLKEMGISMDVASPVRKQVIDGKECKVLGPIRSVKTVDFVTHPAAGGSVDLLESSRLSEAAADDLRATKTALRSRNYAPRGSDGDWNDGKNTVTIADDGSWECCGVRGRDHTTLESHLDSKHPSTPPAAESFRQRTVEAFQLLGMSAAEAKIAAKTQGDELWEAWAHVMKHGVGKTTDPHIDILREGEGEHKMISLKQNLVTSFMTLGLSREEAEIAAAGSGQNPSNNGGQTTDQLVKGLMTTGKTEIEWL